MSDTWDAINERRCALIRKNVNRTITPEEASELERLQQLADERIRELAPLPVAELEAYMRAHGIEIDEKENMNEHKPMSEVLAGITGQVCNQCKKNFAPRKLNGLCDDCATMWKWKLVIFDADGTLRRCTVEGQPCPNAEGQWELIPGVREKMAKFDFGPNGILIGIASNQAGVSLGYITEHTAYQLLKDLFIVVTDRWPTHGLLQICPHPVNGGCDCRKPAPGMLLRIMQAAGVPANRTLYVGDMESDEQAARAAGVDFQWAKDFFPVVTLEGEDQQL